MGEGWEGRWERGVEQESSRLGRGHGIIWVLTVVCEWQL